jgi:class 3 adenylate cyclase
MWLDKKTTYVVIGLWSTLGIVLAFLEPTLRSTRQAPALTFRLLVMVNILIATMIFISPGILLLMSQIREERGRSETLLRNILPESIARRLKIAPGTIADGFAECSVVFADLVGFTDHSRSTSPEQLVDELNAVFSRFDQIVTDRGGEKIKTIGDGYMAVVGVPQEDPFHASIACHIALDMRESMSSLNDDLSTESSLRIGVNTGPVVAGVIGKSKFAYDLWGTTVNVASRLESSGRPGVIRDSDAVVAATADEFCFESLGAADLRGVGEMNVHALVGVGADTGGLRPRGRFVEDSRHE